MQLNKSCYWYRLGARARNIHPLNWTQDGPIQRRLRPSIVAHLLARFRPKIQRRAISKLERPYRIGEGTNELISLGGPLQKPASELQRRSIVPAYLLAGHSPPTL